MRAVKTILSGHPMMLLSIVLLSAMLWLTPSLSLNYSALRAEATCAKPFGSGNSLAYITFETTPSGDVVITLSGDAGTSFRANGMGADLSRFSIISNGKSVPASNYFTRQYTNGATTYTLKKISNTPQSQIPLGAIILYQDKNGTNMEWKTSNNTNAWGPQTFFYTYGDNCSQLDAPTIASIGQDYKLHIQQPVPTGATTYDLEIYRGDLLVFSGRVNDNAQIPFTTTNSGTYTVYARAVSAAGGVLPSEPSAPYEWDLQVAPLATYPVTPFCNKQISTSAKAGGINLTIETDNRGRVVFTLNGTNVVRWRNNGVKLDEIKLFGLPATAYFTKVPGYLDGNVLILEPTPLGRAVLRPADLLVHDANMEWRVFDQAGNELENNGWGGVKFSYPYGSGCSQRTNLTAPVLSDLQQDGTVTFTSSTGADSYLYRVYLNGELKEEGPITSGGQIPFYSYLTATYEVVILATASDGSFSQESNSLPWALEADLSHLPASPLCMEPFGYNANSMAELTWETNADGDVVISISGDAGTSFRANGMGRDLDDFTVDGQPASNWFEPVIGAFTYTLHLKNPADRPTIGATIRYRGNAHNLEYITPLNNNAYSKFDFDYIYGTSCPRLETPEIASVSPDGLLTLVADIPGASAYEVVIYRGELMAFAGLVQNGDVLPFVANTTALYTVQVRARGEGLVPSDYSQPYYWNQTVDDYDIPQSEVCDMVVDAAKHITLTAETTPGDSIVFTLHGGALWRKDGDDPGLKPDNLFIMRNPASNFFEWLNGYEGDSVMVLIPRPAARGAIFPGDVFSHTGNIYYTINEPDGPKNHYKSLVFSYTYGTTCSPVLDRLDRPEVESITAEGVVSFMGVDGASAYEVLILDGNGDVLIRTTLASGETLPRERLVLGGSTYCVKLRSLPADASAYRPSYWTDCVEWVASVVNDEQGGTNNDNNDDNLPDLPGKPEPTQPDDPAKDDPSNHEFPTVPETPVVTDTLADQTDQGPATPPSTIPDTLRPIVPPDTIPVTVVDSLANDTDPVPDLPPLEDALLTQPASAPAARKVLIGGQVFILVDDRLYTITGQLVH